MRNLVTISISILFPVLLFCQDSTVTATKHPPGQNNFTSRLVGGGNLGLQFGTNTFVDVSPVIGYKLTDRFIPGLGISYQYIHQRYLPYYDIQYSIYGGSVWARYFLLDNIFADGEYEVLNGEWSPTLRPGERYNITSVLVGGGYRQMFGNMSTYILLLWNLNDSVDSPYYNPVFRVGFGIGM